MKRTLTRQRGLWESEAACVLSRKAEPRDLGGPARPTSARELTRDETLNPRVAGPVKARRVPDTRTRLPREPPGPAERRCPIHAEQLESRTGASKRSSPKLPQKDSCTPCIKETNLLASCYHFSETVPILSPRPTVNVSRSSPPPLTGPCCPGGSSTLFPRVDPGGALTRHSP
ncbi:hypothetical protein HJG60_009477 [Phyllostomus discolor]|uniref:Uncharacterized protein n=1 Tax=Phyllostomus discolor TaxID=89673 RepID=A0A834DCI9_9CHIR|nr:hypothetical protein HJG60_009477 [Phyllostomus discolor]